jgi:hypothetical protein
MIRVARKQIDRQFHHYQATTAELRQRLNSQSAKGSGTITMTKNQKNWYLDGLLMEIFESGRAVLNR